MMMMMMMIIIIIIIIIINYSALTPVKMLVYLGRR